MFGILRTVLALIVMLGHLIDKWQIGTYAVFGFYMISGYLMTCIMHESYGFSRQGRYRFVLNRFLRLYPLYWCAAALSLIMVTLLGLDFVRSYNNSIYLPATAVDLFANISMIYPKVFANEYEPILVPTTWAITVELFFYAAICLGLSKTRRRVIIWLLVSLVYVAYCFYENLGWRYRYFPIMAGSLPFAMGAFIYFLKRDGIRYLDDWVLQPAVLLVALLINMLAVLLFEYYFEMGFYVNALFSVLLVLQIATGAQWPGISLSFDKAIGEYSYPIYLLHWQAGIVASYLLFAKPIHNMTADGFTAFAMALAMVLVVTWILIRLVDRPIQSLRLQIKNR